MTTALITGANKGLGRETARQLIECGHDVVIGCRSIERGERAGAELGARFVQLDVTDDASVNAAALLIEEYGGLDVLVNNAGVEGRTDGNGIVGAAELDGEMLLGTLDTNTVGVVRVLHAFLPVLERSPAPVVVNVSSGLASLARLSAPGTPVHDYPGVAYPVSKTAVNALTVQYAKAFPLMRINAVEPGYTATDLNGNTGHQTVEEGAAVIVAMATIAPDGPTGQFVDRSGPLPW